MRMRQTVLCGLLGVLALGGFAVLLKANIDYKVAKTAELSRMDDTVRRMDALYKFRQNLPYTLETASLTELKALVSVLNEWSNDRVSLPEEKDFVEQTLPIVRGAIMDRHFWLSMAYIQDIIAKKKGGTPDSQLVDLTEKAKRALLEMHVVIGEGVLTRNGNNPDYDALQSYKNGMVAFFSGMFVEEGKSTLPSGDQRIRDKDVREQVARKLADADTYFGECLEFDSDNRDCLVAREILEDPQSAAGSGEDTTSSELLEKLREAMEIPKGQFDAVGPSSGQ
jgi:hypothetical protein